MLSGAQQLSILLANCEFTGWFVLAGQLGVPAPPMPPPGALNGVYDDPNRVGAAGGAAAMPLPAGLNGMAANNGAWGAQALGGLPPPTPLDVMADTGTNMIAPEVLPFCATADFHDLSDTSTLTLLRNDPSEDTKERVRPLWSSACVL